MPNPNGAKRKFESVEEMRIKIDEYFKIASERKREVVTKIGQIIEVSSPAPLHIQGLCVHLEISENTLFEYQKLTDIEQSISTGRDQSFKELIETTKKKCESYAVDACYEGQKGNKADFILKNGYGWKDRQDIAHSGTVIADYSVSPATQAAALKAREQREKIDE